MPSSAVLAAPSRLSRLMRPVGLLIIVAVLAACAIAVAGGRQIDRMAHERQAELIDNILYSFAENVGRQIQPLAVSHVAADRVAARDLDWIGANFGRTMHEMFGYDAVFVLSGANEPLSAQIGGDAGQPLDYERYRQVAAASVHQARAPDRHESRRHTLNLRTIERPDGSRVRFVRVAHLEQFDGRPAIVTVATIVSDQGVAAHEGSPPLLVVVQTITPAMIQSIGRNFGLEGLNMSDSPNSSEARLVLRTENGEPVATLAWRPDRPASRLLWNLLPMIAPITMALIAFALLVIVGAQRFTTRLESARRDAEYRAEHDELTGLYNRAGFVRRLNEAMKPGGFARFAVAAIDLDRFKDLNDTFGHLQGDAALRIVVSRLEAILPPGAVLARLGGDEFITILPDCGTREAHDVADRMRAAVSTPMTLPCGVETQLGASLGVALAPLHAQSSYELLRVADVALYKAKALGRGRVVLFDLAMDAEFAARRRIEEALRTALARNEISMLYQPIMSHDGERIVSVEALMRWTSATLGEISPGVFVPVAEECGLITELGEYALRAACRDALNWSGVKVAVNVSSVQFRQGDFADLVESILAETGLPASQLEVEITETAVLGDEMGARCQIERLRSIGVSVALDDFGAGYSSLSYLRRFGFDKLKIDQSFVQDLGNSDVAATIVHAIVQMARAMDMQITAEGVESTEQHIFLRAAGCHYIQGFLFASPMDAGRIEIESERAREVA